MTVTRGWCVRWRLICAWSLFLLYALACLCVSTSFLVFVDDGNQRVVCQVVADLCLVKILIVCSCMLLCEHKLSRVCG